jgi:prolyl 4-hydroxylase
MFIYNSIPTVVVKDNVVTPEECDYIIKFAEKRGLQENRINVGDEMVKDLSRTSKGTFAKHDEDKVITDVLQRLASIAGVPLSRAEPATIQRYQPGQEYKPHLDAFKPGEVMPDM